MTSGNSNLMYRKAVLADLETIKSLADQHKNELGFVVKAAFTKSIKASELILASDGNGALLGYVHYHHRKDGQTTLYSIVVDEAYRRQGIGERLVAQLEQEARDKGQVFILLKCPIELTANSFYQAGGFDLRATVEGKHRALNEWILEL